MLKRDVLNELTVVFNFSLRVTQPTAEKTVGPLNR